MSWRAMLPSASPEALGMLVYSVTRAAVRSRPALRKSIRPQPCPRSSPNKMPSLLLLPLPMWPQSHRSHAPRTFFHTRIKTYAPACPLSKHNAVNEKSRVLLRRSRIEFREGPPRLGSFTAKVWERPSPVSYLSPSSTAFSGFGGRTGLCHDSA